VREPLGMTNSRIGYVYLVDENLKIRWAACADAKKEEEEALIRCTGVLLNRNKRLPSTQTPKPPEQ
jgi:ATPase complex subunit ATP10